MSLGTLLGAVASTALTLAAGVAGGALVLGGAWRLAPRGVARDDGARLDAARALGRAGPAFASIALALLLARSQATGPWPLEPVTLLVPGAFSAAAAAVSSGCWLVLCAGRREARGEVPAAERLARLGGKTMFLGAAAWLVLCGASLLGLPAGSRRALFAHAMLPAYGLLVGAIGLGLAGFVGLLAGLSGKPRPSGPLAALLYALALILIATSAAMARQAAGSAIDVPARLSVHWAGVESP